MPRLGATAPAGWRQGFSSLEYRPERTEVSSRRETAFIMGGYRGMAAGREEQGL
jgi:hypothetical protein